jgi:hypothetical protein
MTRNGSRAASVIFLSVAAVAGVAQAQPATTQAPDTFNRGDEQDVRGRSNPEYDPVGIPMGSFRLYPRLGVAAEWNDNVFAEPEALNPNEDWAYILSGGARLASQWGRHELVLEGGIEDTSYADNTQELDPVWRVGADGRLDIVRGFEAAGEAFYRVEYEPRGENDEVGLIDPTKYDSVGGNARISREFNRLRLTGRADFAQFDYEDGVLLTPEVACPGQPNSTVFDQDFRDRDVTEILGRVDYAVSPDTAIFVAASGRWNDYENDGPTAAAPCVEDPRDFDRTRVLGGVALDLTNLVRGEFGIGYATADFDDPGIEVDDVFTFSGSVDWFITELTTINFAANRDVVDSGDSVAPARTVTDVAVRVDHELLRNLILWGRGGWAEWEYEGPIVDRNPLNPFPAPLGPEDGPYDRTDTAETFSFGADWLVNRWAAVQARYLHINRDSEGADDFRNFEQNRATVGLVLRR